MILFVDLEHPRLQNAPALWAASRATIARIQARLAEISGEPCQIIRYDEIHPTRIGELSPRAMAVSGCFTDYEHYPPQTLAGLRDLYRQPPCPLLGFCAGMQLMAETHGAALGPIGPLSPQLLHPPTPQHPYPPTLQQETGFLPIQLTTLEHPLLAGLPPNPIVFQAHYWEVKTLPESFQNLAQSHVTPIQMMAHRTLPLFGTQFHTEQYNDKNLDGRRILENFFALTS